MNPRTLVVVYLLLSTILIAPGYGRSIGSTTQAHFYSNPTSLTSQQEQVWVSLDFLNQLGIRTYNDKTSNLIAFSVNDERILVPASLSRWSPRGLEIPLQFIEERLGNTLNLRGQRYWLPSEGQSLPSFPYSEETPLNYRQERVLTATGHATIFSLNIPNFGESYHLTPMLPTEGIGQLAPLSEMAIQQGVVAAINANFFDPGSGLPIGLLLDNNRLEYEDYASRGAFGLDLFGNPHFLHLDAKAYFEIDDQQVLFNGVNRPIKANEMVMLTPAYGTDMVRLPGLSKIIQIKQGKIISIFTGSVIQPDVESVFIVATGQRQSELLTLSTGDELSIKNSLNPQTKWPLKMAVSGGPMLIQNGLWVLDPAKESFKQNFASARAARSAIGITAEGTLILMIVPKNNQSTGMTFAELTRWFQARGAVNALAFDGGGSASMSFRVGIHWKHLGGTRNIAVGLGLAPK